MIEYGNVRLVVEVVALQLVDIFKFDLTRDVGQQTVHRLGIGQRQRHLTTTTTTRVMRRRARERRRTTIHRHFVEKFKFALTAIIVAWRSALVHFLLVHVRCKVVWQQVISRRHWCCARPNNKYAMNDEKPN